MANGKKRHVVINRCKYELATEYGHYHTGEQVVKYLPELGIPYIDLEGPSANKAAWDRAITENDAVMVDGVGHGNPWVYTGQNQEPLLNSRIQSHLDLMEGRWGSFLSCEFGQAAKTFVDAGMKGFFGYTELFSFVITQFPNAVATPFFRAHYAFDRAWFEGKKSRQAFDISTEAWNQAIEELPDYAKVYAAGDRDARTFEGDLEGGPYVEPPAPFKCCVCQKEFNSCQALIAHICEEHCLHPPPPERPWWCKIFGGLVGCPLP